MPALYNMTITTKGLNLRARAEAEELVLQFTKVAIGNGDYDGSEDLMSLADLKSKKQELGINSKTYEENTISLKTVVANTDLEEGYYIKEIGVYAQDPEEGEILYSISIAMDDKWDYLPAEEWGPASIQYSLDTAISNADQVEIKPGSGAYALAEDLEALQNPEFEDYEGETALPEMETALGQIKSGNGLTKILQYIKAALRILDEREVDMSTYDQAIQELIEMDDQQNEDIGNLQNQMASFEATKSDIVSSSLGQAIGLTASSIWSQIVEKIKAVVNCGSINQTLNAGGSYTIPQGYHNGSGKVTANSLASQTSANAGAAQILSGYNAWVNGSKINGSMPNRGALNWSGSNTTYGVPAGYYSGGTLDSRPSYNAGVTAADNRSNPNSANYKAGYNAGVNAGKNTMASTLSCVYGYANNADNTKTYTASSAGYYLAIACAAGTGNANQNRSASISTNGSSKSYIRRWVADSVGASQGKCQHCVAVMLVYLNPGNTVTMTWESDYNKSGHAIVYKLG